MTQDVIGSWSRLVGFMAVLLAVLTAAGVAAEHYLGLSTPAFLALALVPLAVFMISGTLGQSQLIGDVYLAGRAVPASYNGMALAAQWMSGAVFFGLTGAAMGQSGDGLALICGWSMGFFLGAVFLAPYLNKSGALTVPDFLARRFGGAVPRFIGLILIVVCCILLLKAEFDLFSAVAVQIFQPFVPGFSHGAALAIGLGLTIIAAVPGGLRSLTMVQVVQYVVIVAGVLVPAVWISMETAGTPIATLALAGAAPVAEAGVGRFAALALGTALATAALPPLLMRYFCTPLVRDARRSAGWALCFALPFFLAAPVLAMVAAQMGGDVLAVPGQQGLPMAVSGLVAAAALAAMLATAAGLTVAIGNTLGHDLCFKTIGADLDAPQRVATTKILLFFVPAVAAYLSFSPNAGPEGTVTLALALLASGLLPPLLAGIWDGRATGPGAAAGMVMGIGLCGIYTFIAGYGPDGIAGTGDEFALVGIAPAEAALVAVPLALLVIVIVSRLTPAPDTNTLDYIDDLRVPRGVVRAGD